MRLKSYQVRNFRSVDDSGPIEVDGVTALIGTNESGKTNLLLPLWKLNPAKDGEINPTADYPRKRYNDFRNLKEKPIFVEACFSVPDNLTAELAELTGFPAGMFGEVLVSKTFGDYINVTFPRVRPDREVAAQEIVKILEAARTELKAST